MPILQNSYDTRHGRGQLGAIADSRHVNSRSLTWVGPTAGDTIAFGQALGFGAAEGEATLSGTGFAGIVIRQRVQDAALGVKPASNGEAMEAFADRETVGLLTEGAVWVKVAATVAPGDVVRFDPATGNISNAGGTLIADAVFETAAAAGELARAYLK